MTRQALHNAVTHYRASVTATDDETRIASADRAQDYGTVVLVSVGLAALVAVLCLLAGRCAAESVGAFTSGAGGWTPLIYGLTWATGAAFATSARRQSVATMMKALDGQEFK